MVKSNYLVIGIMSGTSLDGIDIVYVEFQYDQSWSYKIHDSETITYSESWKTILSNLTLRSKSELKRIDELYTEYLGQVVFQFIKKRGIETIDFVSSHGHTALHQPSQGLTFQIGNLQKLSDILKQKVICDFRIADVKLGGQGAPLVPVGDHLLFSQFAYCLNLGGFANISYLRDDVRIAYDICPVNIVMNHYALKLNLDYDDEGRLAQSGAIDTILLETLNGLPYYRKKAPKSLGLEWVEHTIFPIINAREINIEDILRTCVEHIAIQISKVLNISKSNVLVTGGGAYNDFLISRLAFYAKSKLYVPEKQLIEYKEALIFAFLGVLKCRNEVNCLRSVTGASKNHSSGRILVPKINI